MALSAIKRQNIYEQVVEHLKRYIVENSLRPGDRLPTEAELAETFAVSRQSVREAVKVLESMGLVETRPRYGSRLKALNTTSLTDHLHFVFTLDGATFAELAITRSLIECAFLPTIIQRADDGDFARMRTSIEQMRLSIGSLECFIEADMQFHQAMMAATKNRVMSGFGVILQEFFAKMRSQADPTIEQQEQSIREHELILKALLEKDLPLASSVMRRHFQGYTVADQALLAEQPA